MHNSFYHRTLTSDQGLQRSRTVSLDRHYVDLSFTEGASMVWRCPQRQECCDFPIYVRLLPQLLSVHRQRHHQMIRGWVPLANPLSNLDPTIISMYFHRQLMLSTFYSQWHIRVLDLSINYHHGKPTFGIGLEKVRLLLAILRRDWAPLRVAILLLLFPSHVALISGTANITHFIKIRDIIYYNLLNLTL